MTTPEATSDATPIYPPDLPELTLRAVATGMVFGGVLSICNIYAGLKIGWGMNMSVTAALLGFALWKAFEVVGAKNFSLLECNVNQTAASSAAAPSVTAAWSASRSSSLESFLFACSEEGHDGVIRIHSG